MSAKFKLMNLCNVLTWRAESALTSITLRNPLLRRMWPLDIPYSFDGDNMFAINTDQGCKTCVYGRMVNLLRRGIVL